MRKTKRFFGLMLTLAVMLVVMVCGSVLTACEKKGGHTHTFGEDGKCTDCGYYETLSKTEIIAKLPTAYANTKNFDNLKVVMKSFDDLHNETRITENVMTYNSNGLGVNNSKRSKLEKGKETPVVNEDYEFISKDENDLVSTSLKKDEDNVTIYDKTIVGSKYLKDIFYEIDFFMPTGVNSIEYLKEYLQFMALNAFEVFGYNDEDVSYDINAVDNNGEFTINSNMSFKPEYLEELGIENTIINSLNVEVKIEFNRKTIKSCSVNGVEYCVKDEIKNTIYSMEITFANEFDETLYNSTVAMANGLTYSGNVGYAYVPFNIYVNGVLYGDYLKEYMESANSYVNYFISKIEHDNEFGSLSNFDYKIYLDADYTTEYNPETPVSMDLNDGVSIYVKITGKDNYIPVVLEHKADFCGTIMHLSTEIRFEEKMENFNFLKETPKEGLKMIKKFVFNGKEINVDDVVDLTTCKDFAKFEIIWTKERIFM